jgi:hypothetical protein
MREIEMKVRTKIMATAAALAMGSFVATAGNAEYNGPQGGHSSKTTVKSTAVSASGGLAVKHRGTEVSLALQYNKSEVEAKAGKAAGEGSANATAGSTAETKSSSHGGPNGPVGAETASIGEGSGGPRGGCGCSGTSASSEGSSAASASVGG